MGRDPVLTSSTTEEPQLGVVEDDTPESEVRRWGSTLEMFNPLTERPLLLDYKEGESTGEDFLVSEEDDKDNSSFVPPVQTLSSPCLSAAKDAGEAVQPQPSTKCVNAPQGDWESPGPLM